MRVVVASGNSHKLKEIKRIFSLPGLELLSRDDFSSWPEWEETGADYYENALIKARAVFGMFGLPTLSDDSGLEVDYLQGRPGLFSARYSGREGDYRANNLKLLDELSGVPLEQRTARFVCVALCLINEEDVLQARGVCEGHIENRLGRLKLENAAQSLRCKAGKRPGEGAYIGYETEPGLKPNTADEVFGRTSEGFGYDPIFIPRGYESSMAEISAAGKDALSHRGNALRELAGKVTAYMSDNVV